MRNIALIIGFLCAATLTAQDTYLMWKDIETQRFGKEVLFKIDNKFLNGPHKLAENSGAYTEVAFKNGKMIDLKKDFDMSGNLKHEVMYNQDGKPEGKVVAYYPDGTIYEDFKYKDGLKEGEWKSFDEKGELRKTEIYKNDLKEGKWVAHFRDARLGTELIETSFYKNDKRTGTWSQKTEDGRML